MKTVLTFLATTAAAITLVAAPTVVIAQSQHPQHQQADVVADPSQPGNTVWG